MKFEDFVVQAHWLHKCAKSRLLPTILMSMMPVFAIGQTSLAPANNQVQDSEKLADESRGVSPIDTRTKDASGEQESIWSPQLIEERKRLEEKFPDQSPQPRKWGESGHLYTTYVIAKATGMSLARSHRIAFYAQFPDDVWAYDAVHVSIFSVFDQKYRAQIMSVLHSLHGGNAADVRRRRSDLQFLIADGISNNSLEDYQLGLLIHAFGDSFSHTLTSNNEEQAFGYVYGHLFHGHEPDLIVYNHEKYKDFSCELFKALAQETSCRPALDKLFLIADGLAISRNRELPKIVDLAVEYGYDRDRMDINRTDWNNAVSRRDVIKTIDMMEKKFRHEN